MNLREEWGCDLYTIKLNERITKRLESIPRRDLERIWERISKLSDDPRPRWTEKLKGRLGWRMAVGNYRILYTVDDDQKIVTVVGIDDRKDVYRKYS